MTFRERVRLDEGPGGHQWRSVIVDVTGYQPGDVPMVGTDGKWRIGKVTGSGPDYGATIAALEARIAELEQRATTTYFNTPSGYEEVQEVYYDPATGDVEGVNTQGGGS